MLSFPNAKINLGLRVLRKRSDGFHDIETVLYPIGWCDVLEIIKTSDGLTPQFIISGLDINAKESDVSKDENLVIKTYKLLQTDFDLPPVYVHLHKAIPAGAGLGGGSSDAAHTLKTLNQIAELHLNEQQQLNYLKKIGSDCAFFLQNKPAYATGRGEVLCPVDVDLSGHWILVVKPEIHINTGEAYSWVTPDKTRASILEIIGKPIQQWKEFLTNDFETPVFNRHPVLAQIKQELYQQGALYAAMSGSGSAVYGIFDRRPAKLSLPFSAIQWIGSL